MKPLFVFFLSALFLSNYACLQAQSSAVEKLNAELPYYQIPDYPESFSSGNIIGRMIDGLGYRYHWATEGLENKEMTYKISADARNMEETLDHILGLSNTILNVARKQANVRPKEKTKYSLAEKRMKTLTNLAEASEAFKKVSDNGVGDHMLIFKRGDQSAEFPLWNLLNGPLADAIYHVGQIVSFRRAAGNPMNPKVNVFMGKNRGE